MIKFFLKRVGLELAEKLMILGIFILAVGIPMAAILGLLKLASMAFGEYTIMIIVLGLLALCVAGMIIHSIVSLFKRCWEEAKREKEIDDDYRRNGYNP